MHLSHMCAGYAVVETSSRSLSWTRTNILSPFGSWTSSTLKAPPNSHSASKPPSEPASLKALFHGSTPEQADSASSASSVYSGNLGGSAIDHHADAHANGGFLPEYSNATGSRDGVHLANGELKQGVVPPVESAAHPGQGLAT